MQIAEMIEPSATEKERVNYINKLIKKYGLKVIVDLDIPGTYCFPKKYFTKQQAITIAEKIKSKLEDIEKVTSHQVRLIHCWYRCSWDVPEYDEDWRYVYLDEEYGKDRKFSERYAPTCWCVETTFNEEFNKIWEAELQKGGAKND